MLSLSIDNLDILSADEDEYIIEAIEGLGSPEYRVSSYENPGEDGGTVSAQFYATRMVTITGKVKCTQTTGTYDTAKRNLLYACRIRKNDNGFPQPVQLRFTIATGVDYFAWGYVKDPKFAEYKLKWQDFILSIILADPFIYGAALTSGQVTRPIGGGATFPWIFDPTIEFGSTTGGTATVNNAGTADTWPIITLRGVATNPSFYSVERGVSLSLNLVTGASDVVVINMKNKTIMLNGNASLLSAKTGEWFSLPSGVNRVRFSTGSSSDTGTIEVNAYAAYLGV